MKRIFIGSLRDCITLGKAPVKTYRKNVVSFDAACQCALYYAKKNKVPMYVYASNMWGKGCYRVTYKESEVLNALHFVKFYGWNNKGVIGVKIMSDGSMYNVEYELN